jgi:hypothetical protein
MYDLEQLWDEFDALNKQRKKWAENEGTNNDTHKLLDNACQSIYDLLISRFQQVRTIAKCNGRDPSGNGKEEYTEWHCGHVYKNMNYGILVGEFYCKDCGCMAHINTKGEYV